MAARIHARVRSLVAFLAAALCAACLSGCVQAKPETGELSPADRYSLFHPGWTWVDEEGRPATFEQWRGTPLVISMVYTTCSTVCPRTIVKLRRVREAFLREGKDAQFVLVTLDPSNDTPERLRNFKTSTNLPGEWHLLTGPSSSVRELTDMLDLHTLDDGSHIAHESRIVVFDHGGISRKSFRCCDFVDASAVL
jgi:protein SCO1/2